MLRRLILAALLLAASATAAVAQVTAVRPHLDWRTVNTRHFAVHYPREMEAWALDLAGQLDAVRDAVSALVGFAPAKRVQVIVEDPANVANGSAYPDPDGPAILVWPNPPEPGDVIGQSRTWAEILGVHEYAHVAHLIRESRNPRQRLLWRIAPATLPAVLRKAPRWLYEGYATYVEGKLTGSGRPHGTARPAILRQWALEGRMPTYAQLSGTSGYMGGAMAYLAGSAYLEWLVDRGGDSSLVHLWRRMSARIDRDFTSAFMGVYGAPPDELYGHFVVDLTRKALDVRGSFAPGEIVEGELVQRRRWATGEPAISPDGSLMAVTLATPTQPARLVVWRTVEQVDTAAETKARERMLELDPQDVPAIRSEPTPKRAVATLRPRHGIAFDAPRFLPDGRRLLVSHLERTGDGALRPDLFVWSPRDGRVHRVTHGAGVRYADPTPDGRGAIGVRCLGGACDLVAVSLETGDVRTVRPGTVREPFYRPRVSPDGRSAVVSVQQGSRWRLALVDLPNGDSLRWLGPDDGASRYDAAFEPDGRALVYVSEASGIANLERLDLATGEARTLTRVTSAVTAPEPGRGADSAVYFLHLHARGLDLRRLHPDSAADGSTRETETNLAPATRVPPADADTFARAALAPGAAYGLGPRSWRWYPGGTLGADGAMAMLAVAGMDPVGRLTWIAQGGIGQASQWRGGSLEAAWRRFRPAIEGTLFWTGQRRSEQRGLERSSVNGVLLPRVEGPDLTFMGATLSVSGFRDMGLHFETARVGVVAGRMEREQRAFMVDDCDCVDPPVVGERIDAAEGTRALGYAELGGGLRLRSSSLSADLSIASHGARGRTRGTDWYRVVTSASAAARAFGFGLRADGGFGVLDGRRLRDPFVADPNDVLRDEAFVIGGSPSPFADRRVLSHLVEMPALPAGMDYGDEVYWGRLSTSVGPVRPYYWIGGARFRERLIGDEREWKRVIGLEQELAFSRIPFLRVPTVVMRFGAGYSLDEPSRKKARLYANVDFRP